MAVGLRERPYSHETQPLVTSLRRVAGRIRLMRWVKAASLGAFCGVCASLVGIVLGHLDLLPDWLWLEVAIPAAILLGAAVGSVFGLMRPVLLMDAARVADARLGLKERLSSALEFDGAGLSESPLMRLQISDAARYAGAVRAKDAVPFQAPWQLKALIASLVVLVLALFVPTLPLFTPPAEQVERSIVKKEGDKLEQQAKSIQQNADALKLPHTEWVAEQMHRLAQQMQRGHMDKRQAFVRYGKLTQQMRDVQRELTQSGSGQGTKSLAAAGQQLSRALQGAGGQQSGQVPNSHANAAGQGRPAGGTAAGAGGSGKAAAKNGHTGFNIPNIASGKPGGPSTNSAGTPSPTAEVQQAARAMAQGSAEGLAEQLRQLASRVQSGQMSPADLNQAQQDLQKLADALKDTPLKETQQHAQAAADALRQGDKQRAADEMRKAADAAEREMRNAEDANGMQNAQQSLQQSQSEMAGAASPADIGQQQSDNGGNSDSGQQGDSDNGQSDSDGSQPGNGQGSGDTSKAENELRRQGEGSGDGQNGSGNGDQPGEEGNGGGGSANRAGHGNNSGSGKHRGGKFEKFQGPPGRLNPNFDPTKFPKYAKIYLGKPGSGKALGRLASSYKVRPAAGGHANVNSSVPYYDYIGPAKKAAENAVDHEDIPPAYKKSVQQYFDSLTPAN